MSGASAPFSFHCVICIEPFNLTDRPPVVLPCGHTFICELCSKRIKRCFECRTSLFITRPSNSVGGQNSSNHNVNAQGFSSGFQNNSGYCDSPATPGSRRTGGYQGHTRYMNNPGPPSHGFNNTPNKKMEQIPLPLPKNHVLLALMQSAETRQKASKNYRMTETISDRHNLEFDVNGSGEEAGNSDDDNEDEAVLSSLDELSSSCGTYIVKDRYGLPVYSTDDFGSTVPIHPNNFNPSSKATMTLTYGQRIQVVAVEDGMFYLARSSGVVFANAMQLVKVGVAKERSCQIEGMVNAVQESKASLTKKLHNLLQAETNLRTELDGALSHPPDHPIIEESVEAQKKKEEEFSTQTTISASASVGMMDVEVCSTNSTNSHVQIQMQEQVQIGSPLESLGYLSSSSFPPAMRSQKSGLADASGQIVSDESISTPTPATPPPIATPRTRRTLLFDTATPTSHTSEPQSPFRSGLMCGSSIFPLLRRFDDDDDDDDDDTRSHIPIRRSDSEDLPSSIFDPVDFRTGMSGHIALNRAHRKYKNVPRNVRLMGEHRGIAAIKNIRRTPSSPIR